MSKTNVPIIVGVNQFTQKKGTTPPLDPLKLMVKTSSEAFMDSGSERLKGFIDAIYMVNIQSWSYPDAPGALSQALGIEPKTKSYIYAGGNTPQMLVNRAAKAIITGETQGVLLVGGEAAYTKSQIKKRILKPDWPRSRKPTYIEGENWRHTRGTDDVEHVYKIFVPATSYALYETAMRGYLGRSIEEHNRYIGKLYERFSEIASANPHSWITRKYTSQEITTPTPENRYLNHPFTKRMCANMYVDQSCAVLITTQKIAEETGINKEKWVYLMGYADFDNIFSQTRRPRLYESLSAREGSRFALKQAGLKSSDITAFDLYSCFPSMVQILMRELNIPEDDDRDVTLTGGLPYFGGPWSNYSTHAIVKAVEMIRKDNSQKIMVIANGGLNTRQSIGVYGAVPPTNPLEVRDDSKMQEAIHSAALPEITKIANGLLTIEAYTFMYNRNGEIYNGVAIGNLDTGDRSIALIEADLNVLNELVNQDLIGKTYSAKHDSTRGLNVINL